MASHSQPAMDPTNPVNESGSSESAALQRLLDEIEDPQVEDRDSPERFRPRYRIGEGGGGIGQGPVVARLFFGSQGQSALVLVRRL